MEAWTFSIDRTFPALPRYEYLVPPLVLKRMATVTGHRSTNRVVTSSHSNLTLQTLLPATRTEQRIFSFTTSIPGLRLGYRSLHPAVRPMAQVLIRPRQSMEV